MTENMIAMIPGQYIPAADIKMLDRESWREEEEEQSG